MNSCCHSQHRFWGVVDALLLSPWINSSICVDFKILNATFQHWQSKHQICFVNFNCERSSNFFFLRMRLRSIAGQQEIAASSAKWSWERPLFSLISGQDSTMWNIVWAHLFLFCSSGRTHTHKDYQFNLRPNLEFTNSPNSIYRYQFYPFAFYSDQTDWIGSVHQTPPGWVGDRSKIETWFHLVFIQSVW